MTPHEWNDPSTRTVRLLLGSTGGTINGLVVINGSLEPARIHLPSAWILQGQGVEGEATALVQPYLRLRRWR